MPYKHPDSDTVKYIETAIEEEQDQKIKSEMAELLDKYKKGGYLFSNKYSDQWYIDMETSLGGASGYGTQSLMRCNPRIRGGSRMKTENAVIMKKEVFDEQTKGLTFVRAWDLASSVKQVVKSDPDYTVGVKMAVKYKSGTIRGVNIAEVYIADVKRGRWEAPKRNKYILETAINDGLIKIGVEAFGAYKDAYVEIKAVLRGVRVCQKIRLQGDKLSKASCLEPVFESHNIFLLEDKWNSEYLKEFSEFPSGSHDDQVDATAIGFNMFAPVDVGFSYEESLVV
jgi:predicted phage terminase large subunit-like protein